MKWTRLFINIIKIWYSTNKRQFIIYPYLKNLQHKKTKKRIDILLD